MFDAAHPPALRRGWVFSVRGFAGCSRPSRMPRPRALRPAARSSRPARSWGCRPAGPAPRSPRHAASRPGRRPGYGARSTALGPQDGPPPITGRHSGDQSPRHGVSLIRCPPGFSNACSRRTNAAGSATRWITLYIVIASKPPSGTGNAGSSASSFSNDALSIPRCAGRLPRDLDQPAAQIDPQDVSAVRRQVERDLAGRTADIQHPVAGPEHRRRPFQPCRVVRPLGLRRALGVALRDLVPIRLVCAHVRSPGDLPTCPATQLPPKPTD